MKKRVGEKSDKKKQKPKKIYKWYLYITIIFAIIYLLNNLYPFIYPSHDTNTFLTIMSLVWIFLIGCYFVLNIVIFILILTLRIEKKSLAIPILYFTGLIISGIVGFFIGGYYILMGYEETGAYVLAERFGILIGSISQLVILTISIYFLKRNY